MTIVQNPFIPILGLAGTGLNGGKVYIGVANQDPESNPQAVFWDEAMTVPATQPLDVSGGYIMRAGTPAQAFTAPTYSIRVRDRLAQQVFYRAEGQSEFLQTDLSNVDVTDAQAAAFREAIGVRATQNSDPVRVADFGWSGTTAKLSQDDIDAHPEWIGKPVNLTSTTTPWTTNDLKDTAAVQEAVYAAFASGSTPGAIVPNNANTNLNRTFEWPAGTCYIGDTILFPCVRSALIRGAGLLVSEIMGMVDPNKAVLLFDSVAYTTFENFHVTSNVVNYVGLMEIDYTGNFVGLAAQQNRFFGVGWIGAANSYTAYGLRYNRIGGSGAQASETSYYGYYLARLELAGIQINGSNALGHKFYAGDIQGCPRFGIANYGGSFNVFGGSCENQGYGQDVYPVASQLTLGGADFANFAQAGGYAWLSSIKDVRSESDVAAISPYPMRLDGVSMFSATSPDSSQRSHGYIQGITVNEGTLGRTFMIVDDGGPAEFGTAGASSTTTNIVDSSQAWTVNQWVGYTVVNRFVHGFVQYGTITANTATTLTTNLTFAPGSLYKIVGKTAASAPAFDGAPSGFRIGGSAASIGTGVGINTTSGSAVVSTQNGDILSAIQVGWYLCVYDGFEITQASTVTGAPPITRPGMYIGKVLSKDVPGQTITLDRPARRTVSNMGGYYGQGLTDGQQKWMDLDFNAFATNGAVVGCMARKGRVSGPSQIEGFTSGVDGVGGRTDWLRNMSPASFIRESYPTHAILPSVSANALDLYTVASAYNGAQTIKLTSTADPAITCSSPLPAGQEVTMLVYASGGTVTPTFGAGAKAGTGSIAAGTFRTWTFQSDGTNLLNTGVSPAAPA